MKDINELIKAINNSNLTELRVITVELAPDNIRYYWEVKEAEGVLFDSKAEALFDFLSQLDWTEVTDYLNKS